MKTETAAIEGAKEEAAKNGIRMAVTFNPYAEHDHEAWGYCPEAAAAIFSHEEVRKTVDPDGSVKEVTK